MVFFCFQAEQGIRDWTVTGVQPCSLPIFSPTSTVAFAFGSENTIQPFAQGVPPVQAMPSAETQVVTVWPSLIASERAYCRSPRSPLTSADMRYELVM